MNDNQPTSSVCPLCAVGCRLTPGERVEHRSTDNRARGSAGPANPNGRLCRKGVGAYQLGGDDRLTEPQVRRDGDLRAVSWDTAYKYVVDRVQQIGATDGPNSLAFLGAPHCTNEENYLLQKLARTLGTNNVDNRARLCHVSSTRTLSERVGRPATTGSLADLNASDLIVVAGANPAERQPIAFNSFVRPAVMNGAILVHVDPVGNQTTRLADYHVAPQPGMDALVFDLLSAAVIEEGGVDHAFINERTHGYDSFVASLAGINREQVVTAAGVDAETIRQVVELLTAVDRVAALVGTGIEADEDDPNAAEALLDLLLVTGNLGRRGAGLYVLRGLANEQGATDAGCVPDRLPGHQRVTDPEARSRIAAEWGVDPPAVPGKTASELLAAFGAEIRGAVVVGENPAISKRDSDWIRRRLDGLDLLVVCDIYPSETTRHADVVLPVAAGVEKQGTVTNLERRVQRSHPTREPPETVRSDFDVLCALGGRLFDEQDYFDYSDVGEAFDELARVAPTHEGFSYASIGVEGCQWPVDSDGTLYTESFDTPDGLARFGTAQHDTERQDGAVDSEPDGRLQLVTGGRASEFAVDSASHQPLRIHPGDADDRAIESGAVVVVSNGPVSVETTVDITDRIRQGTVSLSAQVADPLLRRESSRVTVSTVSEPTDGSN